MVKKYQVNTSSMQIKSTLSILALILFSVPALSQQINIKYNYSSARKLIEVFEQKKLSDSDFEELMSYHGTQIYLRKLGTFFSDINKDTFKQSLKKAVAGTPDETDSYMLNRLIPKIESAKQMIKTLSLREAELTTKSAKIISQYAPKEIALDLEVHLVFGIVGGGWTFDDLPNTFYIDISILSNDFDGLLYLSAHELFHKVQERAMPPTPEKHADKVIYLISEMIKEGMATYVADFTKAENPGDYANFNIKSYKLNLRRIESNFSLFETLIYRAQNDVESDIDNLYNIGLSGQFDSPLYFVGYYMIDLLQKQSNGQYLKAGLRTPDQIIKDYFKLKGVEGYIEINQELF